MSTEEYMYQAIKSANILRTALGRKLIGPLTVAPHVIPGGPIVSVYLSGPQAEHLASIVQKYSPTTLAELLEWMDDFEVLRRVEDNLIHQHSILQHSARGCDWSTHAENDKTLKDLAEEAHQHLEEHEK